MRSNAPPPKSALRSQPRHPQKGLQKGSSSPDGTPQRSLTDSDESDNFTSRSTSRSVSFIEHDDEKHFFSQLPALFAHKSAVAPHLMSPDQRSLVSLASVDHMPKRLHSQIAWPDGQIYSGPLKEGKPHGQGSLILKSGQKVQTRWRNGRFVEFLGEETLHLSTKDVSSLPENYEGMETMDITSRLQRALTATFAEDLKDSLLDLATHHNKPHRFENTIAWPNGQMYQGSLKNGRPHGEGVVMLPSGMQIPSFWKLGRFLGVGVHDPENEISQQIEKFPSEEHESQAYFTRADIIKATKTLLTRQEKIFSVYAAEDNHLVAGRSLLVWPNGQIYRGGFQKGLPHGYGEVLPGGATERIGTFWADGQVIGLASKSIPAATLKTILSTTSDPDFSGVPERMRPARPLSGPQNTTRLLHVKLFLERFLASKPR